MTSSSTHRTPSGRAANSTPRLDVPRTGPRSQRPNNGRSRPLRRSSARSFVRRVAAKRGRRTGHGPLRTFDKLRLARSRRPLARFAGLAAVTPRRTQCSALRTVVGAVAAAPVGLAIGYFAPLWLKGPQADVLEIAKFIPTKFLPPSFSSAATRDETAVPPRPAVIAESTPEPVEPPAKESETIPASYVTPIKPAAEKPAADETDRYATQSPPTTAKPDDVTPIGDAPREEPRLQRDTAGSLTRRRDPHHGCAVHPSRSPNLLPRSRKLRKPNRDSSPAT